jgi:hypothetical protein
MRLTYKAQRRNSAAQDVPVGGKLAVVCSTACDAEFRSLQSFVRLQRMVRHGLLAKGMIILFIVHFPFATDSQGKLEHRMVISA